MLSALEPCPGLTDSQYAEKDARSTLKPIQQSPGHPAACTASVSSHGPTLQGPRYCCRRVEKTS